MKRGRKKVTHNEIVEILHKRDHLSYTEAIDLYSQGREEILKAIELCDYTEAENLMIEFFGLEMDYIFDII